MKLHSKCVPLDIDLQQVEGWRAKHIFSKCLNLKMMEKETKASNLIRKKAKVKLAECSLGPSEACRVPSGPTPPKQPQEHFPPLRNDL